MSAVMGRVQAELRASPARRERLLPFKALGHVLVLAALVSAVATYVVFVPLGGGAYYGAKASVRGTLPEHKTLRPSGPVGNALGIAGTVLMASTLAYVVRKRIPLLAKTGSPKTWLEVHIFCGIVGPVFITLHSSFKFGGIISVAFWSMALVVGSGFVGRYLYVRIPKTLRGTELSLVQVEARAAALKRELAEMTIPVRLLTRIEAAEREMLPAQGSEQGLGESFVGDVRVWLRLARLRREIADAGIEKDQLQESLDLVAERVALLRRASTLARTKRLFELWHVFHRPLVWVLFSVATLHIGVAFYMGYTLFGR